MRSLHRDLARFCMIVLFGASAWFGVLAGTRLWRPCLGRLHSPACEEAQSVWLLPETIVPEGVSLLLLGFALVVLSLLGRMPGLVRTASLSGGALYLLLAYDALSRLDDHNVVLAPYEEAWYAIGRAFLVLAAPLAMGLAGLCVLRRPHERHPATPARVLSFIWLAMVAGSPLAEYAVFSFFYNSHDGPLGMGLLRSAMTAACALVLLGSQVWVRWPGQMRSRSRQRHLVAKAKPPPQRV